MTKRWVPYDDSYPSCALCFVQFRIYGGELTPDEISEVLDLQADKTDRKGDVFRSLRGERIKSKNIWQLSTRRRVDSRDLRRHLDYLLDLLLPRKKRLAQLQARDDTLIFVRALHAAWFCGHSKWPVWQLSIWNLGLSAPRWRRAVTLRTTGRNRTRDGTPHQGDVPG